MAEKIINSGIEFAYASSNIEIELKKELEKYFLYQTIVIIDKYYEFGEEINILKANTMCNIIVERNIEHIKDFEKISCIIIVNNHDVNKVKLACSQNNIPYIFALTNICDSFCFKNYAYINGASYKNCNYPLGIVFSIQNVYDFGKFISKTILEISSLSFGELQSKIDNLFFQKNKQDEDLSFSKKILNDLKCFFTNNDNSKEAVKNICKIYLSYCIYQAKFAPCLLDNLLNLYDAYNSSKKNIEIKYIFSLLITSMEKIFFMYYTTKFKSAINYEKHIKFLSSSNQTSNFKTKELPDSKINFLLQEFRPKFLEYISNQLSFETYIKSQIADIDIDYLYNMFSSIDNVQFTNLICLEQDVFKDINFLTIMYNNGLLNFDF